MERTRATGGLVLLTVIVVSAMIGLHRMGTIEVFRIDWSNPLGWLETAKPTDAVAAVARSVGLAIGYWTVAGALLYALAAMRHGPTDNLRWLAHPGIRRLVDTALATALTLSPNWQKLDQSHTATLFQKLAKLGTDPPIQR